MIPIKGKGLLICCEIINYFMIGFGNAASDYKFDIEWISEKTTIKVEKWQNDPDLENKPLYNLSPQIRRAMCVAAKQHASLDGMIPKDDIFPANGYILTFPDGSSKELVAMRCSTIPVSHLYFTHAPNEVTLAYTLLPQEAQDELTIVIKENQFLSNDYKFHLQIIKSDPVPEPEDFIRFGPLTRGERFLQSTSQHLDICIAATKRIKYEPSPVMTANTVLEKLDWYQYDFPQGLPDESMTCFTIKCPSSPTMYLYMGPDYFIVHVHVVIVESEKDPTPEQS